MFLLSKITLSDIFILLKITLSDARVVKKVDISKLLSFSCEIICIYDRFLVPLLCIQSREAGENPAQSRCCDSQSDVQILISHWFLANWED